MWELVECRRKWTRGGLWRLLKRNGRGGRTELERGEGRRDEDGHGCNGKEWQMRVSEGKEIIWLEIGEEDTHTVTHNYRNGT